MKLPNWMMLCVLMVGGISQYSVNAIAGNMPAFSADFQHLVSVDEEMAANVDEAIVVSAEKNSKVATIDINKASATELSALPGIGSKKALAIVKYRELNGDFVSVEELVNVRGIGPKMLAKLSGFVSV